jgi:hypothetical protein
MWLHLSLLPLVFGGPTLAQVPAESPVNHESVNHDATVAYNGIMCDNNTLFSAIPQGKQSRLVAFKGNRDYERILLGFDLPQRALVKCVLLIPKPVDNASADGSYNFTISLTDNDWDEATVSGRTKAMASTEIARVVVDSSDNQKEPVPVDITQACHASRDRLSLFIDTSFPMIVFNSIESGSADIFAIEYACA